MSNFISKPDYYIGKRQTLIDQITDDDDTILDDAEQWAIDTVRDHLFQHFDVDTIFEQEAEDRNTRVVKWCIDLVLYRIYDRVDDDFVPESVVKNYDETMAKLEAIAGGNMPVDLPRLTDEDDVPKTKFQSGGEESRSTW